MADGDVEHQKKSIEMYKQLSKKFKHWVMVSCVDDKGKLMSKRQVHERVLEVLEERGIIDRNG